VRRNFTVQRYLPDIVDKLPGTQPWTCLILIEPRVTVHSRGSFPSIHHPQYIDRNPDPVCLVLLTQYVLRRATGVTRSPHLGMLQTERSVSPAPKMSSGKLWDDLGSTTFVTTKGGPEKAKSFTDDAKRRELSRKIAESSDDELDFLSSSSRSDNVVPTRRKPRVKKQLGKASIQGREVDHHPDCPPKKKFPDFKKITKAVPEEASSSTSRSKTSNTTHRAPKQTKSYGILATLHDNENERLFPLSDGLSSDKDSLVDYTHPSIHFSPHDTPRGSMKGATSYRQHKLLHNKTSSCSFETNNRPTPTSRHTSRIQSSDSSDTSEATPRAKHPKNRIREFPTLDPLSVSDSVAPELDGGKGKAPFKGATRRVPSKSHQRVLSDTTTPRKNSSKSRYPFPSPLSSPAHQLSQDSATALREMSSQGSLNITAAEDADDESQKRRPQLRPFPMSTGQSRATSHSPRQIITCTQPAYPDNGRNNIFPSDLEVFGDDSRQQHPSMLVARLLIFFFQFFLGNQWIHRAYVLSVMKNSHSILRRSIAPFSKPLDARRVLIRAQLILVG
jgi:hypothetical protein